MAKQPSEVLVATVADIHIRVDELPVGISWNYKRLSQLAEEINSLDIHELWVLGDLFDRSHPIMSDIISAKHFIDSIKVPVKFIEGNHERISRDIYTLNMLKNVLGMEQLPERFDIGGVSVTALGHNKLHNIKEVPPTDLLLSHFRWSHNVFGKGELSKSDETHICKTFGLTILGDIHYPYEPAPNVKYISSPYSINYGTPKDYGIGLFKFIDGEVAFSRKILDLPCKISAKLALKVVNGFIASTQIRHLYKVVVDLRYNQMEEFKKLRPPENVVLIPKFIESKSEHKEVEKIEVGANIKEVLLGSIELPEESDKDYIKDILKED